MTRLTAQMMWSNTKYYDFTLYPSNRKAIDCDYIKQVDTSRLVHSGIVNNEVIAMKIAQSLDMIKSRQSGRTMTKRNLTGKVERPGNGMKL